MNTRTTNLFGRRVAGTYSAPKRTWAKRASKRAIRRLNKIIIRKETS